MSSLPRGLGPGHLGRKERATPRSSPASGADEGIEVSSGVGAVNMSNAKRAGSIVDHTTPFLESIILRYVSDGLYTGGDEVLGITGIAVGVWK